LRYVDGLTVFLDDTVLHESNFSLLINGSLIHKFLCTSNALEYLAIGYLFSEGYINTIEQIQKIQIDLEHSFINVTTDVSRNSSNLDMFLEDSFLQVQCSQLLSIFNDFEKSSLLFKETGSVHSAGLIQNNKIICLHDDIGRHNAVDKVIGEIVTNQIPTHDKVLAVSSRVPLEIIKKASKIHIPVMIAVSAPTLQSIEFAQQNDITLIGMVRHSRMNIYSGFNRIQE